MSKKKTLAGPGTRTGGGVLTLLKMQKAMLVQVLNTIWKVKKKLFYEKKIGSWKN